MDDITLISGLPRSGTSMMMQILEAGGVPILTDHLRSPDPSNPKGYYEFERVKKLQVGDTQWVKDAQGKAVKVISDLLEFLPAQYSYNVIFMQREITEVLASQKAMLLRRQEDPRKVSDEQLQFLFTRHLTRVKGWLSQQPNMRLLVVNYSDILANPQMQIDQINRFLGGGLDTGRMNGVVDAALYRQRSR